MSFFQATETELMKRARDAAKELHKEAISVKSSEGQMISFAVAIAGCQRFIEVGTLTGYSSLWIHQALSADGELWTIEKEPAHIAAAAKVFSGVNGGARIQLLEGDARQKLAEIEAKAPFDGIFIDGNKGAYLDYLVWAETHIKCGGLVILDNLYLGGALTDPNYQGKFSKRVIRQMHEVVDRLSNRERFRVIGFESRDGLTLAQKLF